MGPTRSPFVKCSLFYCCFCVLFHSVRPKEIQQQKHRLQALAAKQKTHLERTTRRRTKFDFDLWDQSALKSDQKTEEIKTNQWIAPQTKDHVLKTEGKLRKALPKDYKVFFYILTERSEFVSLYM